MNTYLRTRKFDRSKRPPIKGIATVEFAVCLPILVIVIFGSIEACNMIFLKQTLTEASHQGALLAMKQTATETQVTNRIQSILDARNVSGATIEIAGGNYNALLPGDLFTIRVTADAGCNRISPTVVSSWQTIEALVTTSKQ